MNAWWAWPQAGFHLCFSIAADLMTGMAELTRPTPPPAPAPVWPDGEPIWLPTTDRQLDRTLAEFAAEPSPWDEVPLRQEP